MSKSGALLHSPSSSLLLSSLVSQELDDEWTAVDVPGIGSGVESEVESGVENGVESGRGSGRGTRNENVNENRNVIGIGTRTRTEIGFGDNLGFVPIIEELAQPPSLFTSELSLAFSRKAEKKIPTIIPPHLRYLHPISHTSYFAELREKQQAQKERRKQELEELHRQAKEFSSEQLQGKIKPASYCISCRQRFSVMATRCVCAACRSTFCAKCIGPFGISFAPVVEVRERKKDDAFCCELCSSMLNKLYKTLEIANFKYGSKQNIVEMTFSQLLDNEIKVKTEIDAINIPQSINNSNYQNIEASVSHARKLLHEHFILIEAVAASIPTRQGSVHVRDLFFLIQIVSVMKCCGGSLESDFRNKERQLFEFQSGIS